MAALVAVTPLLAARAGPPNYLLDSLVPTRLHEICSRYLTQCSRLDRPTENVLLYLVDGVVIPRYERASTMSREVHGARCAVPGPLLLHSATGRSRPVARGGLS
jgi:hypothetical protein